MDILTDRERLIKLILDIHVVPDPSSFVDTLSVDDYADKLIERAINYVFVEKGKDAGFLSFYANDKETKTGYIALIGVLKEFQGKGIAQNLMDLCIQECRKAGMNQIKLEVKKENKRAIQFYRHYEFIELQDASVKSIYMQKVLEDEE